MRFRMIEFCSRKRMVLAVLGLISVSVVVLMVENGMSTGLFGSSMDAHQDNASRSCFKESICRSCSPVEIKNEPQCWPTGFVRNLSCSQMPEGHYPLVSCPRFGEKSFWLFECIMVLSGLSSYAVVVMRQNRLNRLLIEKVNRQITAGL